MRKIFLTILILLSAYFCKAQSQPKADELLFKKRMDSLISGIANLKKDKPKQDTMVIKVDQLAETFKKDGSGWFEKLIPALIALLTVAVSSFVAYKIGMRNISVQKSNTEKQTETQLSIAADNLFMSKEQLEQNTKNTLAQIRSNNISKARIEWIQNLRPLLSEFFANVTNASIIMDEAVEAKKSENSQAVASHINSFKEILLKLQGQNNQIELFLNPKNTSHKELKDAIDNLSNTLVFDNNLGTPENKNEIEAVINKSRIVLKEAWEQAKNETVI